MKLVPGPRGKPENKKEYVSFFHWVMCFNERSLHYHIARWNVLPTFTRIHGHRSICFMSKGKRKIQGPCFSCLQVWMTDSHVGRRIISKKVRVVFRDTCRHLVSIWGNLETSQTLSKKLKRTYHWVFGTISESMDYYKTWAQKCQREDN